MQEAEGGAHSSREGLKPVRETPYGLRHLWQELITHRFRSLMQLLQFALFQQKVVQARYGGLMPFLILSDDVVGEGILPRRYIGYAIPVGCWLSNRVGLFPSRSSPPYSS